MSAVAKIEQSEKPKMAVMNPEAILQLAIDKNFDLERIEKMLQISEQWRKINAERAFDEAIAAFKANPPQVFKDATNNQFNSKYASIGNLVNTVNPHLAKHGLSASWDISQTNGISVTCILAHVDGHKRSVTMVGPADTSGSKNALQQIKSTRTYLQSATFESVTGIIASNDSGADDDGNSAVDAVTEEQACSIESLLTEVGAALPKFLVYMRANSIREIKAKDYQLALSALEARRGK